MNAQAKSEPIFAVTLEGLAPLKLKQGLNLMDWEDLEKIDPAHLLIAERSLLEHNPERPHWIPYLLVNVEHTDQFFTYQRGKGVGESRLAGNDSNGLGGHVDEADCIKIAGTDHYDIKASLMNCAERELAEEFEGELDELELIGLLVDHSNEVGKVHIGVVMAAHALNGDLKTYRCKEQQLRTYGFTSARNLIDPTKGFNLESWSKIIMTHIVGVADGRIEG